MGDARAAQPPLRRSVLPGPHAGRANRAHTDGRGDRLALDHAGPRAAGARDNARLCDPKSARVGGGHARGHGGLAARAQPGQRADRRAAHGPDEVRLGDRALTPPLTPRFPHLITSPAVTFVIEPVMPAARSDARNAAASATFASVTLRRKAVIPASISFTRSTSGTFSLTAPIFSWVSGSATPAGPIPQTPIPRPRASRSLQPRARPGGRAQPRPPARRQI